MSSSPDFSQMHPPQPSLDQVTRSYEAIQDAFDQASTPEERVAAVRRWDELARTLMTWGSMANLRFSQDTRNPAYKAERELCDELSPSFTELEVAFKRKLIADPNNADIKQAFGDHAFALWETDITTFEPAIRDDLVQENKLTAEYVELLTSAKLAYQGETYNLSGISRFAQDSDRQVRHETAELMWSWFEDNGEALDRIFDDLVELRTRMARSLGYDNYIDLGYRRMQRVDYNQQDVERFREQVQTRVVPLAKQIRERQAKTLGVERLMSWDEAIHDSQGNPAPEGDHDWMLERATEMFDAMSGEMGEFFRMMRQRGLLDLKIREGKASGGFCTSMPDYDVPFIFANFNGTKGDVEVFTHEVGHAFQNWMSRDKELLAYQWPTYEACEIHSMGLEFLTWPHMDKFFNDAERFRTIHLTESLLFLPYGVAVDHFQHLIYENPDATPAERKQLWLEMEATYLPWRDWGDLSYPASGGRWQRQGHIYNSPFYYIDYTLALSCALQLWDKSERDYEGTLKDYIALCSRGGEAPFLELVESAGLVSPFEEGCLDAVVARAERELGLSS
ncbi:MAG: peptidase M3 [Myxococcales bacterium]|nr:peptidase M3 [Myxococcales bacterium]